MNKPQLSTRSCKNIPHIMFSEKRKPEKIDLVWFNYIKFRNKQKSSERKLFQNLRTQSGWWLPAGEQEWLHWVRRTHRGFGSWLFGYVGVHFITTALYVDMHFMLFAQCIFHVSKIYYFCDFWNCTILNYTYTFAAWFIQIYDFRL